MAWNPAENIMGSIEMAISPNTIPRQRKRTFVSYISGTVKAEVKNGKLVLEKN
jgi:hypothetical protein